MCRVLVNNVRSAAASKLCQCCPRVIAASCCLVALQLLRTDSVLAHTSSTDCTLCAFAFAVSVSSAHFMSAWRRCSLPQASVDNFKTPYRSTAQRELGDLCAVWKYVLRQSGSLEAIRQRCQRAAASGHKCILERHAEAAVRQI